MNLPKLPAQTSPFLWGAAAGAIALSIVGFAWGGWVTGATHERLAAARAETAMVAALTPICVTQFQANPRARASLVTLTGSSTEPSREVAAACAAALVKAQ